MRELEISVVIECVILWFVVGGELLSVVVFGDRFIKE